MERINPGITLREAIKEAQETREIYALEDPMERANAIAVWLDREYPFAWTIKARQGAAARAVGVPSQKELEKEYNKIEKAERAAHDELAKLGWSLIGASGLFVVGNLWAGALGTFLVGASLLAIKHSLDKPE